MGLALGYAAGDIARGLKGVIGDRTNGGNARRMSQRIGQHAADDDQAQPCENFCAQFGPPLVVNSLATRVRTGSVLRRHGRIDGTQVDGEDHGPGE